MTVSRPRLVRLAVAGFKSFAEPATLDILPGLTGIVGPNGCGKSNVAEALRWAMGEGNARTLRGAEMDDLIFAGTATRPSRNLAEVSLVVEGDGLPAPFTGQAELHVVRRIERGIGSSYRVNGREARARDVQTLFADLASGARSSAMVSQGRVGAIVGAHPDDRRVVLEEAAGITGLHARRAEADGKLRAAEANLARAEDTREHLERQLAGLRSQARQAERYRTVSEAIGAAEAGLLALAYARAVAARNAAAAALNAAQGAVVRAAARSSTAGSEAATAAVALPALRVAEAETRTALERVRTEHAGHQAAAGRARDALAAASTRRAQVARDLAHAEQVARDAAGADARLAAEAADLEQNLLADPDQAAALQEAARQAAMALREAEAAAAEAGDRAAGVTAQVQALAQVLAQAETRAHRSADALARVQADRSRAALAVVDPARIAAAQAEQQAADAALGEAQAQLDRAERARAAATPAAAAAREAQNRADAARARLAAEASALAELLAVADGERWPPMIDRLQVPPGLEAALGAALGGELDAAANPGAARHWRTLPALPAAALPGEALAALVQGPPALGRALSGIGVVADDAAGDAMQPELRPGQSLVSRAGAVWRWDGYTVRAGTPTAAAIRLQQRNRLTLLRTELAEAEAASESARTRRASADAAERQAAADDAQARLARRSGEARADRARQLATGLQAQAAAAAAKLTQLDAQAASLAPEAAEAAAALDQARAQRAALPDAGRLRSEAEQARAALAAARKQDAATTRAVDAAARDHAARQARRTVLAREREDWQFRAVDARDRVRDLDARRAEADAEQARLADEPAAVARRAEQDAARLGQAEAAHKQAAAALMEAERIAASTAAAARTAEAALGSAREALARAEAVAAQAEGTLAPLPAPPGPAPADLSQAAEDRTRSALARLVQERDDMGPVNLRAEIETAEIEDAMTAVQRDRDELAAAIAKLRGGLGQLNQEGRERLQAVFQQVDRHFQALFSRMFGGGRAHLAMVGSDDPLQAGLEIYAQPPGKKLTTLTLLSGGEQALTALSLVFAVFRCNPAPVCVLDEVDAPLDDANVDRFCSLLHDMARENGAQEGGTRFLVVTHHQLTMARMDRLYGVTMQERGVSRLLSVDLGAAVAIVDAVAAE